MSPAKDLNALYFITVVALLYMYLAVTCNMCLCTHITIIEGFGGKRAVGFLLKIELCRKRSKFRMQFCLGA